MDVKVLNVNSKGNKTVSLTNMSSFAYLLDFGGNPVILNPFCSIRTTVGAEGTVRMTVENMWCGENAHPEVVIDVE